jgi:multicomponent Na+:H+ antiporter subunit A
MAEEADGPKAGLWRLAPALVSLLAFLWFLSFGPQVAAGEAAEWAADWLPRLGVEFAFLIDGLGLTFALLVTGIGALILLYTSEYFRTSPRLAELMTLLGLFEVAMLGLVLADDVLTLFVFWEGTTITSFLLIGYDHEKADARAKAMQALIVTGMGGLALLAGLFLMGMQAGTFRLSEMGAMEQSLAAAGLYLPVLILVLLGCFTKSAQIPFHYWLPNAMAAPTPVSAYLHSATMVKAGVYLLARLSPNLGDAAVWDWTLTLVGGATMLLSSVWALRQSDLKLALAFTTVMGLGTLTMLLGIGTEAAVIGMVTFLLVHAFYKAALFLSIGILDKMAGSREAEALSGLGRAMPLAWAAAALAALSMAGLPPFLGFIGKEEMYAAALEGHVLPALAAVAMLFANVMMIAIAGAVGLSPFIGRRRSPKERPRDAPLAMWAGPATLAALGLLFGLVPSLIDQALVAPVAASILGHEAEVKLYLWHGVNVPFLLSLLTFAIGFALWWALPGARRGLADVEPATPAFEGGYDRALAGALGAARGVARTLQSGRMTRYLRLMALTATLLLFAAWVEAGRLPALTLSAPPPLAVVATLLIAAGALTLPFTLNRLLAVTALGVSGVGVALFFALYGAIDVAITQLMVETLVVVIIAVALLKLPRLGRAEGEEAARGRRINAVLSGFFGLGVAGAFLFATEGALDLTLTAYFEDKSYVEAFGRNIVNVILVDFRALDTFGEIAVVAIAGLSALALLAAPARALKDRDR